MVVVGGGGGVYEQPLELVFMHFLSLKSGHIAVSILGV